MTGTTSIIMPSTITTTCVIRSPPLSTPSQRHAGRWVCSQFVLAVSEVNAFLAYRFFCRPDPVPTLQQFWHKLAWQLIKNRFLIQEETAEQNVVRTVHQLMNALPHATKFQNGVWICNAVPKLPVHGEEVWGDGEKVQNLLLLHPG